MSRPGWSAEGLLRPLWEQLPGKRAELARRSGMQATELSSHNTGKKPIGVTVAQKIIAGFASAGVEVTLADLGAPAEVAAGDPGAQRLIDRLESLEAEVEAMRTEREQMLGAFVARLADLEERLANVEQQSAPPSSEESAR